MDLKEELKDLYGQKVWSEVSDDLKVKMKERIKNNLITCNMEVIIAIAIVRSFRIAFISKVPTEKDILRRLKGFYSTRRNTVITNNDRDKSKKRKLMTKANRLTYVSLA